MHFLILPVMKQYNNNYQLPAALSIPGSKAEKSETRPNSSFKLQKRMQFVGVTFAKALSVAVLHLFRDGFVLTKSTTQLAPWGTIKACTSFSGQKVFFGSLLLTTSRLNMKAFAFSWVALMLLLHPALSERLELAMCD